MEPAGARSNKESKSCKPSLSPSTSGTSCKPSLPPSTSGTSCKPSLPPSTSGDAGESTLMNNNPESQSMLASSIHETKMGILSLLLELGAAIDEKDDKGRTPLLRAMSSRCSTATSALISRGADVKAKNIKGNNALQFAVTLQDYDLVIDLVKQRGVDVNERNEEGCTPLFRAIDMQDARMVELLLSLNANPNSVNYSTYYPLHLAAQRCNHEIVSLLISFGANPNCQTAFGRTPLHYSVHLRHLDTISAVLRGRPNVDLEDDFGESPYDLAEKNNFGRATWLLTVNESKQGQEHYALLSRILENNAGSHCK